MPSRIFFILLFLFNSAIMFAQPGGRPSLLKQDTTIIKRGNFTELFISWPNSKFKQMTRLKNGKKHGKQETIGHNGQLMERTNYVNGFLNGNQLLYDYEGNIKEKKTYKYKISENRSVLEGQFYIFRRNVLYSQAMYKDSLRQGPYQEFYPDGKLSVLQHYSIITNEKGKKIAVLNDKELRYKADGKLLSEGTYENNEKSGEWTTYFTTSDSIASRITYKNNKRHGPYEEYFTDGKLSKRGIFYQEIQVSHKKELSVQDGRIESYFRNGNLSVAQHYYMGKLHGLTQHYYESGILKSQTEYINGIETGERKTFYINGRPGSVMHITGGMPDGELLEYYESGQLKQKLTYLLKSILSGSKPISNKVGWQYDYDPTGKLTSKNYYNQNGEDIAGTKYINGLTEHFRLNEVLYVYFDPKGKLMSFRTMASNNRPVLGYYFYSSQKLRKVNHQDPITLEMQGVDFTDQGDLLNLYFVNLLAKKGQTPNWAYATEIARNVSPEWTNSPLFTDTKKHGKYELKYSNNRSFITLEFKDDLLDGQFLVRDPIHGDTLVYKNFQSGIQRGYFVEKSSGRHLMSRGSFYNNGLPAREETFSAGGIPNGKRSFDHEGKLLTNEEYYENGVLKLKQKLLDSISTSYDMNGKLLNEHSKIEGSPGWAVYRQFYHGSGRLKSEQYYLRGKQDSTLKYYYENGKLYYQMRYWLKKQETPNSTSVKGSVDLPDAIAPKKINSKIVVE